MTDINQSRLGLDGFGQAPVSRVGLGTSFRLFVPEVLGHLSFEKALHERPLSAP